MYCLKKDLIQIYILHVEYYCLLQPRSKEKENTIITGALRMTQTLKEAFMRALLRTAWISRCRMRRQYNPPLLF